MIRTTRRPPPRHRPRGLEIIHDDRDILVVNKEPGLLTMSFRKDQLNTAERILTDYVRKGSSRSKNRVFVVHRLDRDSSGLLIFAKSYAVQQRLKNKWDNTEKLYLAAVHGRLSPRSGVIESYLAEDKNQFVASTSDTEKGRLARTGYCVIKQTRSLSIIRIKLFTGRKNQIRVHFAEKDHPVVGDKKYGQSDKAYERLALHAKSIAFHHPHHGERMVFNTKIPEFFVRIAGGLDETDWDRGVAS
jgi:tRNA pseudouridine32 synthase/23S rRNA pseudouridine746 synthase/23S rRNA pseudouridine1911/1915/1917 synthase